MSFVRFIGDESGALTIDWVALSAGILLAGLVAVFAIYLNGASPAVVDMNTTLSGLNSDINPGSPPNMNGN